MRSGFAFIAAAALMLFLSGCASTETSINAPSGHEDPVLRERMSKDEAFKSGENSPIPPEDRAAFQGLSYYPPDPSLRFNVRLQRHARPQKVKLGTNTGEIRTGLRYGYFEFQAGGQSCLLQAYRLDDNAGGAPYLFVPFRDATSGKETYGAGRYLDLKENTSGIYDLDFNRAYNPFCAYNDAFSCPFPPAENTLGVAIRAGEKLYSLRPEH